MAGQYRGVQARIKELNPIASFIPCAAHSLNLVGKHAASDVLPAKLLLGQIQNFWLYFSSSPLRWNFLKRFVNQTLKGHSATRWASKAEAVSVMYEEFEGIAECLIEIMNSETFNGETVAEANCRYNDLWNFKFILGLTIWNVILHRIQICNLALQSNDSSVEEASKHLEGLLFWLTEYQQTGFESSLAKARTMASRLQITNQRRQWI